MGSTTVVGVGEAEGVFESGIVFLGSDERVSE